MELNYLIFGSIILLAVLMAITVFWLSRKSTRFTEKDRKFFISEWQKVENLLQNSPPHAVMEADKIFDNVLFRLGYKGSFVDKFRPAQRLVKNPEAIWNAHKIRNRLAHESGFTIDERQARGSVSSFRSGLHDLGIKV